jgi:hypothetical protein
MKTTTYLRWTTLLSAAGATFAGYLSSVGLRSGLCAFGDPCKFFLGQPAYYTSLALFSTTLLVSVFALLRGRESRWPAVANAIFSTMGSLFATQLTVGDLWALAGGASDRTGFPVCAYGLGFFVAILVLSLVVSVKRSPTKVPPSLRGAHHGA